MSVEVIGLFANGSGGTENALAQVDVPQDGFILGIDWDGYVTLNATGEFAVCELSFIATNQISTNDVRGRISSVSSNMHILTSGIGITNISKYVDVKEISVAGGERLYLHVLSTAGVVSNFRANLHFEMTGGTTRRSARRR